MVKVDALFHDMNDIDFFTLAKLSVVTKDWPFVYHGLQ